MNFSEIADGVHLLAYPVFGVNCALVVGGESALLVDTLSTDEQAGELLDAVRRVTALPLTVVNTHFHFDHCFGNATVSGPRTPIYGHPDCALELAEHGERWRRQWQEDYEIDLSAVTIKAPDHLVPRETALDLGDRQVKLSHHGRGHTAGDLVVWTGQVLIAGDLVEQGAPPAFEDAYPLEWPEVLAELLRLADPETLIVPGHGDPVDIRFLREQHDELTKLDWLIRDGHADDAPIERVATLSPLNRWGEAGAIQSHHAVRRGYAHLDGRP